MIDLIDLLLHMESAAGGVKYLMSSSALQFVQTKLIINLVYLIFIQL